MCASFRVSLKSPTEVGLHARLILHLQYTEVFMAGLRQLTLPEVPKWGVQRKTKGEVCTLRTTYTEQKSTHKIPFSNIS